MLPHRRRSVPRDANAQTEGGNAVVRLDPALDALIASDAKLERLATGFGFTEGTIWGSARQDRFPVVQRYPGKRDL
jgi:hypothetical protein